VHGFGFTNSNRSHYLCNLTQDSPYGTLSYTTTALIKTAQNFRDTQVYRELICALQPGFGRFVADKPVHVTLLTAYMDWRDDWKIVVPYPSELSIPEGSAPIASHTRQSVTIKEALLSVAPTLSSALGGTELYLFGSGFIRSVSYIYSARFDTHTSPQPCKAMNSTVVVCLSPVWPRGGGKEVILTLSRFSVGNEEQEQEQVQGSTMFIFFTDFGRTTVGASGAWSGGLVSILGEGFRTDTKYVCRYNGRFCNNLQEARVEVQAVVLNSSVVTCQLAPHRITFVDDCCERSTFPFYWKQALEGNSSCNTTEHCAMSTHNASNSSTVIDCCKWMCALVNSSAAVKAYWGFPATDLKHHSTLSLYAQTVEVDQERVLVNEVEFEIFAQVNASIPTSSGSGLTHVITIIGAGFDPFRSQPTYFCSISGGGGGIGWYHQENRVIQESALAYALDMNQVLCTMPSRVAATTAKLKLYQLSSAHVSTGDRRNATVIPLSSTAMNSRGFFRWDSNATTDNELIYAYYPQILTVTPSHAPAAMDGSLVNVSGAGFTPTADLKLRFSRRGGRAGKLLVVESPLATFVSETQLFAAAPSWPSDWGAGFVNATLIWDGFEVSGFVLFLYDETVSSVDSWGRASGDFVSVSGYAFVTGQWTYYCSIRAVSNSSRSVRGLLLRTDCSKTLLCNYPAWQYTEELVELHVWRTRMNQESPVGFPLEFHGPLVFKLKQVWWGKSVTRQMSFSGGTTLDVDGFGIIPNSAQIPNYECRFTEDHRPPGNIAGVTKYVVSTPAFGISPSLLQCTSPVWQGKSRLSQLTVHACRFDGTSSPFVTSAGIVVQVGSSVQQPDFRGETPETRVQFERNNMFGIVGLSCDEEVEHIGPWYGAIAFDADPPCSRNLVYPCVRDTSFYAFGGPTVNSVGTIPNGPIRGDATITLSGLNFGYKDVTPKARVGASACTFTSWLTDTTIICGVAEMGRYPNAEKGLTFVISIGPFRANSRSFAFSYDGPDVRQVMNYILCILSVLSVSMCNHLFHAGRTFVC
jgi:hypothetical protein